MRRTLAVVVVSAVAAALYLLRPLPHADLAPDAHPAATYAEALRLVANIQSHDSAAISPACRTRLYTHGARTHRVIVLLHGLTNCPAQFDSLGRLCFARGANVLIPRLPRHGATARMTDDLARLDAGELRAFTDRVLDAAHGLGDSVTVAGLSMGGTLAAWAAEQRPDIDRAVLIAPMLGLHVAGGACTPAVSNLLAALPNKFVWWDPRYKQNLPGSRNAYPRFATHAIAAILRIGWFVRDDALARAPVCRAIAVVTVGSDLAVDNHLTADVVAAWRAHGARDIETYEFPKSLRLDHDVIDPAQPQDNPTVTYGVLMMAIGP